MPAAIDTRAQFICNIGPIISGSIKDDHVQGQGIITRSGEVTLAGLFTPARGTVITFAYIARGRVVRLPRGQFFITRAFANPFTKQTEIEFVDRLGYEKGKGGGTITSGMVEALNGRVPSSAPVIEMREMAKVITNRMGVRVDENAFTGWSLKKQINKYESTDYVETTSDILKSVNRFGYIDNQGTMAIEHYQELDNYGPTITLDEIIDISPSNGGSDFTEAPVGTGTAQQINGSSKGAASSTFSRDATSALGQGGGSEGLEPTGSSDSNNAAGDGIGGGDGTGTGEGSNGGGGGTDPEGTPPPSQFSGGVQIILGNHGSFQPTWGNTGLSTQTQINVSYYDQTTEVFPVLEEVVTSELTADPDRRVMQRVTMTTTSLVKVNSAVIQDYVNYGKKYGNNSWINEGKRIAGFRIVTRKVDNYDYEEIPPPPLSVQEQQQINTEIESITQQDNEAGSYFSNPDASSARRLVLLPKLPTYRKTFEQTLEEMSYAEAIGRIGVTDYTRYGGIPNGGALADATEISYLYGKGVVKEFKRVYQAYGLTQMGQQAIAAAAAKFKATSSLDFAPLLRQFFNLVLVDHVITTRYDSDEEKEEKDPVPDYLAPYANANVVVEGGNKLEIGPPEFINAGNNQPPPLTPPLPVITDPVNIANKPSSRANASPQFNVPFLPDDIVGIDGTITPGNASVAAAEYADQQNKLLIGHRLGLQITTAIHTLPAEPLKAFHITNGTMTATYRVNGTTIAFDQNSCLVSTDALYIGLVGGAINGERWVPLPPGTTSIPPQPQLSDNGLQAPANSIVVSNPINLGDQSAVTALINSLPTGETQTLRRPLNPLQVVPPYRQLINAALQIRLQCAVTLVPTGIERNLGTAEPQVFVLCQGGQISEATLTLQLESSERQVLEETFVSNLSFTGNLS